MIRLDKICKSYSIGLSSVCVLNSISLEIKSGEFVSIMGPSGSGKSTLMNIIGCLDRADSGMYALDNKGIEHDASDDTLASLRNRYFGFVFQSFNLIRRFNALRNVELPMIYAGVSSVVRRQRAHELLIQVGLGERVNHAPTQLSGGQQQRVAIARALANDPSVLIADEPTGSLDSTSGLEIMKLFCQLNASGTTVIVVTHEEQVADHGKRVIRLRDGRVEKEQLL